MISSLAKQQREISLIQTTGAVSKVACWWMRHWVHGPLLCTCSQAGTKRDVTQPYAKSNLKVKSNASLHQAITLAEIEKVSITSTQS